ncbi:hypothetical protein APHNP_0755 [Anaplasma phagocytophilum str. ApNP]|uniref:Uncharacterized protein n=1 Tax=Anaplasma phagocytophilum str. ApNP TaxID=1359153 RepID=A0A0F3NHC3_ANAPH|nr:hypothetical protein APHNP_0755 [Anaplasma phagocytophilum str. ApNP]
MMRMMSRTALLSLLVVFGDRKRLGSCYYAFAGLGDSGCF